MWFFSHRHMGNPLLKLYFLSIDNLSSSFNRQMPIGGEIFGGT